MARGPARAHARRLGLAACGNVGDTVASASSGTPNTGATPNSGASSPTPQASAPYAATIKNSIVTPATLDVSTGETVEIKNLDPFSHNLEDKVHFLYDGDIAAKSSGELTAPANPGTYDFFDPRHPTAKLTLTVS